MPRYFGPTCADCGTWSPVTNTSYTRVSLSGWRSIRRRFKSSIAVAIGGSADRWTIEWRCPACWAARGARPLEVVDGACGGGGF